MKPVFQTTFKDGNAPAEERGNCIQACLASIFEIPLVDAPYLGELLGEEDEAWWHSIQEWLKPRNLYLMPIIYSRDHLPPDNVIYILGVKSTTLESVAHVVVARGEDVIHDPNPNAESVGEPDEMWLFVARQPREAKGVTA